MAVIEFVMAVMIEGDKAPPEFMVAFLEPSYKGFQTALSRNAGGITGLDW